MPGLAQAHFGSLGGRSLDNRRIAAALIDAAVVGVIILLLRALTGGLGGATLVLAVAWALYYFFAFEWGAEGQTIGKRLMGLRVVRSNGKQAGVREVAIRTVLRIVDGIGFYVVGLAAMLATGERRQRIGDLAAGTMVTAADLGPSAPARAPEPASHPPVEPEPEPEPVPPAPVQPLPYEPETPPAEPELPPAATVEIPEPPIADDSQAPPPPPPPPTPPIVEPSAQPQVEPEPEPQMAEPDVPVPPPPPPPAPPPPPEDTPQVRTEGIEIASEIDLVMQDDDEDEGAGAPGSAAS